MGVHRDQGGRRRRSTPSTFGFPGRPGADAYHLLVPISNPDSTVALRVLVYSDNAETRQDVIQALGRHLHPDLPELNYVEVATGPMVIQRMDEGGIDLAILDGEATPTGGIGIAKQLKDELATCPPIIVLTGRPDDAWLAKWSRAEAAVPHPVDPIKLGRTVLGLLRTPAL